jgi:O-antigen/teichoic acid export membrane protein
MHRAVLRNVTWNWAGLAVQVASGLLLAPVLLGHLGAATYGIWLVLGSFAEYCNLLDFGIRGSVGRYVALARGQDDPAKLTRVVSTAFAILSLVAVAGGLLLWSLSYQTLVTLPTDVAAQAGLIFGLAAAAFAITTIANCFDGVLWGFERFDRLNSIDIPCAIARTTLTILLVVNGGGLVTVAAIAFGIALISAGSKVIVAVRSVPAVRPQVSAVSSSTARELFSFGVFNFLGTTASRTIQAVSPALISISLGVAAVTPYGLAVRLLAYLSMAIQSVAGVLLPSATVRHARGDAVAQRRLFLMASRYCSLTVAIGAVAALAFGRDFFVLWVGPIGTESHKLMAILLLGELIPLTQLSSIAFVQAADRHRKLVPAAAAEAVLVLALGWPALTQYGLVGLVWVLAGAAFLTRGLFVLVYACRILDVTLSSYTSSVLIPTAVCAVALGLAGTVLSTSGEPSPHQVVYRAGAYVVVAVVVFAVSALQGRRLTLATEG